MDISYYCCLLSLLLLRLFLARRIVVGKNGAGFIFGLRWLLSCGAVVMGAWSCATAHDHDLLRLRRHPGAPWAAPMVYMFVRGARTRLFLLAKVSYPNKGWKLGNFFVLPAGCLCCFFGALGRRSIAKGVS